MLLRRAKSGGHKLAFKWVGPKRIKEVKSALVYDLEDISTGDVTTAHARRIILYRADMDGKDVDPALIQNSVHNQASFQIVECLRDIRQSKGELEVLVEWSGLPDAVDFTWEPASQICEDVPGIYEAFLQTPGKPAVKAKAQKLFSTMQRSSDS